MRRWKRCIILLWDGVSYDGLLGRLSYLPHVRSLSQKGSLLKGEASLITTTGPAHIPFLYGVDAGTANVPGIRWYDRKEKECRSYIGPGFRKISGDIGDMRSLASFFRRPKAVLSTLAMDTTFGRLSQMIAYSMGRLGSMWHTVDAWAAFLLRRYITQGADLVFAVFPGIDELSHCYGVNNKQVDQEYRYLDQVLGLVLKSEDAMTWVVSDHGLTDTHTHIPLVKMAREVGLKVLYYPCPWSRSADVAIMESGNACAMLYYVRKGQTTMARVSHLLDRIKETDGILSIYERDGGKFIFGNPRSSALIAVSCMAGCERAGDLIFFAKSGYDLRAKYELPEHRASHGSITPEHVEVPIVTNMKLDSTTCTVKDIMPTILARLGEALPPALEGKTLC